jgi:hypothetical protein
MPLMTPPHTDPAQADNVVMTTDSANDPATPDRRRGIALQTAADFLRVQCRCSTGDLAKAQCYEMSSPGTPVQQIPKSDPTRKAPP